MNFNDIYKKIADIDKGISESVVNECGDMAGSHEPAKQQDSVNMNISINGQGSGGIRDLMNILRNIEDEAPAALVAEPEHDHDDAEIISLENPMNMGEPAVEPQHDADVLVGDVGMGEEYGNSVTGGSDAKQYAMAAVIGVGDDLSSKGSEKLKVNGGGNPGAVSESLVSQLRTLYNDVKKRSITESRNMPGYGDEATWGGRTYDYDDYDEYYCGYGDNELETEVIAPYDIHNYPEHGLVHAGETMMANVYVDCEGDDFKITAVAYGGEDDELIDLHHAGHAWISALHDKISPELQQEPPEPDGPDYDF